MRIYICVPATKKLLRERGWKLHRGIKNPDGTPTEMKPFTIYDEIYVGYELARPVGPVVHYSVEEFDEQFERFNLPRPELLFDDRDAHHLVASEW